MPLQTERSHSNFCLAREPLLYSKNHFDDALDQWAVVYGGALESAWGPNKFNWQFSCKPILFVALTGAKGRLYPRLLPLNSPLSPSQKPDMLFRFAVSRNANKVAERSAIRNLHRKIPDETRYRSAVELYEKLVTAVLVTGVTPDSAFWVGYGFEVKVEVRPSPDTGMYRILRVYAYPGNEKTMSPKHIVGQAANMANAVCRFAIDFNHRPYELMTRARGCEHETIERTELRYGYVRLGVNYGVTYKPDEAEQRLLCLDCPPNPAERLLHPQLSAKLIQRLSTEGRTTTWSADFTYRKNVYKFPPPTVIPPFPLPPPPVTPGPIITGAGPSFMTSKSQTVVTIVIPPPPPPEKVARVFSRPGRHIKLED